MKKIDLIIFDLDGTLIQNDNFYRNVYSQSLTDLVKEKRGEKGLTVLSYYRKNFQGRGELSLPALSIPYSFWAERLIKQSIDLIQKNRQLVTLIQSFRCKKIIYTGSPLVMAKKILKKTGFKKNDFNEVIGWEKPEEFPLKWTCSSFVFSSLARKYNVSVENTLVIGDNLRTDIYPARQINMESIYLQSDLLRINLERIQL